MVGRSVMSDEDTPHVHMKIGTLVRNKWKVIKKLGEGGCGEVHEVINIRNKARAALKVEPTSDDKDDEILKMEVGVLRKLQGLSHICRILSYGRTIDYNYLIMTLVGCNLGDLRKLCPDRMFTLSSSARLAIQCLQGIKNVHLTGFVHRDIKPSNFALGSTKQTARIVFILDFGLARQFELKTKDGRKMLREPRTDVPFRGTVRYCSIGVHRRLEQGRHDDLWSLFYMSIEFVRGKLPWQSNNKAETLEMKLGISEKKLCEGFPEEFLDINKHLTGLSYTTRPDYVLLEGKLEAVLQKKGYKWEDPYDWEKGGSFYQYFKNEKATTSGYKDDYIIPFSGTASGSGSGK